eukprot:9109759-Alexandrium_andersonii.AAC.1
MWRMHGRSRARSSASEPTTQVALFYIGLQSSGMSVADAEQHGWLWPSLPELDVALLPSLDR